jgi:hypothetical protein
MAQLQAHPWFKQGLPDGAAAITLVAADNIN